MSMLNEKPEMFGIPVSDFYFLMIGEVLLLLLAVYKISVFGVIPASIFFVFTGGTLYAFMAFKKHLPEHFFFNLVKYFTSPRLYIVKAEFNERHKILKRVLDLSEDK